MSARSAMSRKWIAGGLHAARAAALLTIATGVNGTLSAVWPHYEPMYAYLVAIVLVAFLSSAILGVTAAVAAVILYDWMFSPVRVVPSMSIAVPIGVALLVVLATRAALPLMRRVALAVPAAEPPLLPSVDVAGESGGPARRVDIVDDGRMAALTQQLATARSRYEDESRLRAATESSAREREGQLERELETLRARIEEQGTRSLASRREYDEMRERLAQSETRAAALQQGLDAAQRRADEEQARAGREMALREQLEVAGHESLQNTVSTLATKYEAALLESKQRLEVAAKRLESVQKELKDERARSEREAINRVQSANADHEKLQKNYAELAAKHEAVTSDAMKRMEAAATKINVLQRELDRTLASLSEEHARADREARLRAQLEAAARETLHRTADVSAGHQRDASEARQAAEVAEERALAAEQRTRITEQHALAAQDQLRTAGERVTAAEQRALALEQQFEQARFQLSELRTSHEMHQGAAISAEDRLLALQGELDRLRGEAAERVRSAEMERASLMEELEQSRGTTDERFGAVEAERAALHKELDRTRSELAQLQLGDDLDAAAHARLAADAAEARQESDSLRDQLAAERAQREASTKESDERLRKIVDGINTDYESAIGEALIEKEAARAELRALTKKLQQTQALGEAERAELNRAFDEKLQRLIAGITADYENSIGDSLIEKEAAKAESRGLTKKIAELQSKLEEGKQAHQRLDAEWGEKLQKTVTHLAEDHEADIGEAMVEKQAARAEVRTLSARVASLQQRLEEERERFRQAAERWQQERSMPSRRMPATVEKELPFPSTRTPLVLVVHSDPRTRASSRQSLEESGYRVLTAADGLEGLRTATLERPDVVVAEAVMPKMNARELVQLLKSRPETAAVKVILTSASADTEKGSDFRADEILRDPSDINDLRAALASVLSRRGVAS